MAQTQVRHLEGVVEMEYTRSPGKIAGRFLSELRDKGEILGIRCSKCSHVFVPPQQYCPDCRVKMQTWVPMPRDGVAEILTVVHEKTPFSPWQVPFVYVGVRFPGAHTLFFHRMIDVAVNPGERVRAVLKSEERREGSILDIDYCERVR